MAYIDALTEQEVTLRDFKSVLNRLMTNYNPKKPVTITIEEDGESRTFSLVPKRTRRRSNGEHLPLRKSRLKRWKNQKNRVLTWPLIRLILLKTHRFRLYTACM